MTITPIAENHTIKVNSSSNQDRVFPTLSCDGAKVIDDDGEGDKEVGTVDGYVVILLIFMDGINVGSFDVAVVGILVGSLLDVLLGDTVGDVVG